MADLTPGLAVLVGAGWIALASLLAYAAFGIDKARARRGEYRIAEAHLLALALLGGWPGAKLGQRRFRHKTRKQPFRLLLDAIPLVWIGAAVLAVRIAVYAPG